MEKVTTVMDKQGRIYLPKSLKKGIGKKFYIIKVDREIMLVPIPGDPAKELEKMGKSLPKKSIKSFRKEALKEVSKVI